MIREGFVVGREGVVGPFDVGGEEGDAAFLVGVGGHVGQVRRSWCGGVLGEVSMIKVERD